jgi:hypothetical protein
MGIVSAYVYFVQPGDDPAVKIGITVELERRLDGIQTYHYRDIHLIGVIDMRQVHGDGCGTRVDYLRLARQRERQIHSQFQDFRLRGEWFHLTPPLGEFIRANCHEHSSLVDVKWVRSAKS